MIEERILKTIKMRDIKDTSKNNMTRCEKRDRLYSVMYWCTKKVVYDKTNENYNSVIICCKNKKLIQEVLKPVDWIKLLEIDNGIFWIISAKDKKHLKFAIRRMFKESVNNEYVTRSLDKIIKYVYSPIFYAMYINRYIDTCIKHDNDKESKYIRTWLKKLYNIEVSDIESILILDTRLNGVI